MYAPKRQTKPLVLFAVLLIAVGGWFFATWGATTPSVAVGSPVVQTEARAEATERALPELVSQGAVSGRASRVAAEHATESKEATAMEEKHDWLLSFGLLSSRDELPEKVFVRVAGVRRRATWNPEAGQFLADVSGTRRALEAAELVVIAGEGETATLLPVQIEDPDALHGIGSTPLGSATWDMRLLRVDAGAIQMQEPPRLGALVADSPAEVNRVFRVRWEGGSPVVSQTVYLKNGESRVELATFLPVAHWTAEAVESGRGQPVPEWSATAAAGEDIALPADPTTGVTAFVSSRLRPKVNTVSLLALPAPERTTITVDEMQAAPREMSMPAFHYVGSRGSMSRPAYHSLMPFLVAPGTYMVEAWGAPDKDGVMSLLATAPAVVNEGLVRVNLN